MKNLFVILLALYAPASVFSQSFSLDFSVARSFSGYGDISGVIGDGGLKYTFWRNFYLKASAGFGKANQPALSKEELQHKPNLLVADRWTKNYPFTTLSSTFDLGHRNDITPATDFQQYDYQRLQVGKDIFVKQRFLLGGAVGVGRTKFTNTYVTRTGGAYIRDIEFEGQGTIVVPHLLTFVEYSVLGEAYTGYKLPNEDLIVVFANVTEGKDTRMSSLGIRYAHRL